MRISAANVSTHRLPLRRALRTARGIVRERTVALFQLVCDDGVRGVGEAAPLPGFAGESFAACVARLREIATALEGAALADAMKRGSEVPPGFPCAAAAVQTALCDASAKAAGLSLAGWLGADPDVQSVAVNALVEAESERSLCEAAERAVTRGFGTLKLKVGSRPLRADVLRVGAVRAAVGPDVQIRVDANAGWSESEAQRALDALAPFDLEFVEQPVASDDPERIARLRTPGRPAIALDEAIRCVRDADRFLAAGAADVIVLKPSWLGGPIEAMRIGTAAKRRGVPCVVTSALDSAVGRTAALHVAAALSGGLASGLATAEWLARDTAAPPAAAAGHLALPAGAGLGIAPW